MDTADEPGPSPMGIFLDESYLNICSLKDRTGSDYDRIPPLHDPDWYEDDTDSSDDDDSDFYDDSEKVLLPDSMAPQ